MGFACFPSRRLDHPREIDHWIVRRLQRGGIFSRKDLFENRHPSILFPYQFARPGVRRFARQNLRDQRIFRTESLRKIGE